jgi:phosphoribosyl 1,2-cyclic phosphate phosphodiesterase
LNIYFLGTGTSQGIPVIGCTDAVCKSADSRDKRLRVAVWVHDENFSIVIDCGPDFRYQMLQSGCNRMDALLFTHEHADHTAGLDDIRPFYFKQGDIPLYAHPRVLANLAVRFDYIFATENKYPGAPSVLPISVDKDQPFYINNQKIIPVNACHGGLQVFGYRIGDFAYLTDVKTIEDAEIDKIRGVKVLVINVLRKEPHPTHFNLQEALEFIEKVQPEKTYFTHISHNFGLHKTVQEELPEHVFLAYDNLQITI